MTLYEKYRKLDIDFSQLSLEPGDTLGGYFCTPKGAEVIGWAGVDGIHCCLVKGFGEMVFAVNPSNPPGDYVHPLARSFEDFLCLILACGFDAAEQAWMWNRGEFDAFLETYPPTPEQRAALDSLRDSLDLTPMEDPYGYIKGVQSGFDYRTIPYSKEYYDLMPDESEPQGPPERPEWRVYFEDSFGSQHYGHDTPGKEIPVNRVFTWAGKTWHIPAVYSCGKGLVMDICVELEPDDLRAFLDKWWPNEQEGREWSAEEQEQQNEENPMTVHFQPTLTVNGKPQRRRSGTGFGWMPDSCRPVEEQGQRNQQDWEAVWLMEHYGLDPEKGWTFFRESFPWTTETKPALRTLSLSLEQDPVATPGPRFTVSGAGDAVEFTYPVTGARHTLRVVEYESQEADLSHLPAEWDYPSHYTALSYVVEPELPLQSLTVRDCGQGDRPRPKPPEELDALAAIGGADAPAVACSVGVIGGSDGPMTILLANGKSGQPRAACSALYFDSPEQIEWRMVFYQKTVEGIELDLPLPKR